MAGELERVQSQVMSPLSDAVESAASIITKDYLGHLETYEIIRPSEEDIDLDIAACSKFFNGYNQTKYIENPSADSRYLIRCIRHRHSNFAGVEICFSQQLRLYCRLGFLFFYWAVSKRRIL